MTSHLQRLEAESIHIFREVVASSQKPVMLYSIGKDSAVMLHLAKKAFAPGGLPFPLLHVDTTWKFKQMISYRDKVAEDPAINLIVHINEYGVREGIGPISHGSKIHTDVMKTQALKQALDQFGFDVGFGGARRDEEKSRAKERICSFRTKDHRWDPKSQRPELWNIYNTNIGSGESIRVFPLSNWTELDVWQYIKQEQIDVVPLYFAKKRPIICRDNIMIMVDDERLQVQATEEITYPTVRFRTLGCYPLTGAVNSQATTVDEIIKELKLSKISERQGRAIDKDQIGAMETKKQEGYF